MILKLRKILFWTHLACGVVAGLFILNLAMSGILIAYASQITGFLERDQRHVPASAEASRLDVETVVRRVQEQRPQAGLSAVTLSSDPRMSAMFFVDREQVLFANPYTGQVLGEGNQAARGFFRFMTGWHRWLAQEGKWKPYGQTITGVATIIYFLLLVSGLCLWWPRQWSWSALKSILVFNPSLRGKARDWNWHNVIGLWSSPFLLVVTLTGIIMAFSWANDLLFRLAGSPPPEARRENGRPKNRAGEGALPPLSLEGINSLWVVAEKQVPDWKLISLRLSSSSEAPANFTINRSENIGRPDLMSQLTLDRKTGKVQRWQPYESQSTGRKLRSWVRSLHTGEAVGFAGQTTAVLVSLGGALLVWTGLSLAWRRFFRPSPNRANPTASFSPQTTSTSPSL